jgi:capping protein beta
MIILFKVKEESSSNATYRLTTTVMLHMSVDKQELGNTVMSGSLTRQTEMSSAVNETKTHIANMGRMIEDMENDMRSNLNELYILKTREIINSLRHIREGPIQTSSHIQNLNSAVLTHGSRKESIISSESV